MMGDALIIALVLAQAPSGSGTPKTAPTPAPPTEPAKSPPSTTPAPAASPSPGGADQPQAGTAAGADSPADPETPSADVTRYQFTGLDIDGELRTPALLHFLARIGGEFETVGIPHRTFIPELRSTTSADAL